MCDGVVAACVGASWVFSVEESGIVVMSLTSVKLVFGGLVSVEISRGVSRSSVVVEVASCCDAVGVSCRGGGVVTFWRLGSVGDDQNGPSRVREDGRGDVGVSLSPPECSRRFGRWGCSLMMSAAVAKTVVVYTRLICGVCNRSK
jgi:hypothetical protein